MNELTINNKELKRTDIEKIFKNDSSLSFNTVKGYAGQAISFFTWARAGGLPGIGAVNPALMAHYKQSLIDAGLKNTTINFKLKAVRAFYRQLFTAGKIDTNPTNGMAYEHEEPFTAQYKALSKKQVEILFRELSKDGTERGRQRYALIMLLTLTGVRASEACNLKFKDLIFEGNLTGLSYKDIQGRKLNAVGIRVERGKGGKSRTVEFKQVILDAIMNYRQAAPVDGESLFYTIPQNGTQSRHALNRFTLWYTVKAVCKDILAVNVHPHTFRHTQATISLELGAEVFSISQNLGHSSLDTTSRYLQRRGDILKYWTGLIPAAV